AFGRSATGRRAPAESEVAVATLPGPPRRDLVGRGLGRFPHGYRVADYQQRPSAGPRGSAPPLPWGTQRRAIRRRTVEHEGRSLDHGVNRVVPWVAPAGAGPRSDEISSRIQSRDLHAELRARMLVRRLA